MSRPSVLFACNMNSVRSPMAEAVARHLMGQGVRVGSCGVYQGAPDPYVAHALDEAGFGPAPTVSRSFAACDVNGYDLVVALTPEAATEARKLHPKVVFWEVENPTDTYGKDQELRAAYARLRDQLADRVREELIEPR